MIIASENLVKERVKTRNTTKKDFEMTEKKPEIISLARLLVEFPPRSGHSKCNGKGFYLLESTTYVLKRDPETGSDRKFPSKHRKIEVCRCVGNRVDRAGKIYEVDATGACDAI